MKISSMIFLKELLFKTGMTMLKSLSITGVISGDFVLEAFLALLKEFEVEKHMTFINSLEKIEINGTTI